MARNGGRFIHVVVSCNECGFQVADVTKFVSIDRESFAYAGLVFSVDFLLPVQ